MLPTLIIWGERRPDHPGRARPRGARGAPGSRLVIFESSGHFPHTEEPERFVEALTDFIDTSEALELDEPQWRALLTAGPPSSS